MNYKFKYNIETLATHSIRRFETHVEIEHLGKSTSFFSGLFCSPDTYTNINRNTFSLDPIHYGFEKCYWFATNWIEIIIYDFYIQSLLDPYKDQLYSAEKKIKDDIQTLEKSRSFNYSFMFFLLDKFRTHLDQVPTYDMYASYHRLLDCMLDYQLKSRSLLTKDSSNKSDFFRSVKKYKIQNYIFKLEPELKDFINWSYENDLELFDEQDYIWSLDS